MGTIFMWPASVVASNLRLITVASWLVSSYITLKVIVFSMASQEFSRVQWPVVVYCLSAASARFFSMENATVLLLALCGLNLFIVIEWAHAAITQITTKLDIECFRIKPQKSS